MHHPQPAARASASAFANWVFERNNPHWKPPTALAENARSERMKLGVMDHAAVERFMRHTWTAKKFSRIGTTGWTLWFADSGHNAMSPFLASRLLIDNMPMKCVPDVVLRHAQSNSFLVIERKTTAKDSVPRNGWPNVEAQLWCYSHIDDFKEASNVLLVSQLWTRIRGGLSLHSYHPSWLRGNPLHEARCTYWLTEYGGHVDEDA
jgi:hypothetical protein